VSTENKEKDHSLRYIALVAVVSIAIIAVVKGDESDKYDSIQNQMDSDAAAMNIRVLN